MTSILKILIWKTEIIIIVKTMMITYKLFSIKEQRLLENYKNYVSLVYVLC